MGETPIIELKNIAVSFDGEAVLKDFNLRIRGGEFVTLLGPSGCGKTTTLRIVGGFVHPDQGDVFFNGQKINDVPPHKREVNTIFQKYALFPHLNVYDNVAFGMRVHGKSEKEIKSTVKNMLNMVNLNGFAHRNVNRLSGGQQQRVAFARAIVIQSGCILFDEPLSALDALLREEMRHELKDLVTQLKVTAVFVTHDQTEAMSMSDKIAVLNGGVVEQYDTPEQIYHRPATAFVARFVGKSNWFSDTQLFRPEAMSLEPQDGSQRYDLPVQGVQYLGDTYEITLTTPHGNWMFHCDRKVIPGETLSVYIDPNQIISVKKENPTT